MSETTLGVMALLRAFRTNDAAAFDQAALQLGKRGIVCRDTRRTGVPVRLQGAMTPDQMAAWMLHAVDANRSGDNRSRNEALVKLGRHGLQLRFVDQAETRRIESRMAAGTGRTAAVLQGLVRMSGQRTTTNSSVAPATASKPAARSGLVQLRTGRPAVRFMAGGKGQAVEREGGQYGAGLIRSMAVCTHGEAEGHDLFVDRDFLVQLRDAINAGDGVKSRFTHPAPGGDGLGTFLGRVMNAELVGDVLRGDLHLAKSSRTTPNGDLGAYVMDLADESPEDFGCSVAFVRDYEAEDAFMAAHTAGGVFRSPDKLNAAGHPHARLAKLQAVDVVDDPAANPGGLFRRVAGDASEADGLVDAIRIVA